MSTRRRSTRGAAAAEPAAEDAASSSSAKHAKTDEDDDVEMKSASAAKSSAKRPRAGSKAAAALEDHAADSAAAAASASPSPASKRRALDKSRASSASAASASASASSAPAASPSPSEGEEEDADNDDDDDGAPEEEDAEAVAASLGLSIYEYNRQQNIRLKNERLQMLNLQGVATSIGLKRAPAARASGGGSARKKKVPQEGFRRSLRSSVRDPNYVPPPDIYVPELGGGGGGSWDRPERTKGPIAFTDAIAGGAEDQDAGEKTQMEAVLQSLKSARVWDADTTRMASAAVDSSYGQPRPVSLASLRMLGEGPKIVKTRATVLQFHPTISLDSPYSIVAAADKNGHLSIARFRNDVSTKDWFDSVVVAKYTPHVANIPDLFWGGVGERQSLYSASRDGSVRRMDVEAGVFEEVWAVDADDGADLSTVTMSPDRRTVYVADRDCKLHTVDTRVASSSSKASPASVQLLPANTSAIKSLSINPLSEYMLASAGNDRTVRVWDLRKVKTDKPLNSWSHGYSISNVAFSPSGRMMASTANDDTIKLFSCVNASGELLSPTLWAAPHIVKHNNHTGRWVTAFRTTFAPRDVAFAIGNMGRPIDVYTLPANASASGSPSEVKQDSGSKAKRGGAAAAAASSSSSAAAASSSSSSASFSTSGPGAPAPVPAPPLSLTHSEWVTSIPAAVAWHPTRVQVAGCTGSGRLYVFGHVDK